MYKFVSKDNIQNPYILTLSHTVFEILQDYELTMNSVKDTVANKTDW